MIGRPGCRLSSSEMVLAALFLLSFCKMCECVCVGQKKDTNGAEESVVVSEVSSFQSMQEWYLGWGKVSCLERCPK